MHNQALKKTELIQKIKLAKYIRERFRISEARKKWINLAKKYSLRNKKDDISNLVYKIKQYILLDRMKDPFVHKTRVSVIQMFKDKIKKNQIVVMLKKMLPERNDKNGHDTILKYLGRWKLNAEKLRERQNKFKNALETIEKRNLIDMYIEKEISNEMKLNHPLTNMYTMNPCFAFLNSILYQIIQIQKIIYY